MQSDKKNPAASRQLLVIPSDSAATRLIAFAGQNFNKLPPSF